MKKAIILISVLVFMAGLIFISGNDAFAAWGKKDRDEKEAKAEEVSDAPEPKLIHTFKSAEDMGGFEQLYVSKQATFGRMGVLQAYFAMEQNNITAIDAEMQKKFGFKMDPTRMYDLNRDTLEIRDLGPIAPPTDTE